MKKSSHRIVKNIIAIVVTFWIETGVVLVKTNDQNGIVTAVVYWVRADVVLVKMSGRQNIDTGVIFGSNRGSFL